MFSPPPLKTILASLALAITFSAICEAQNSEFNRRMAALHQARERAMPRQQVDSQVRTVAADSEVVYAAPSVANRGQHAPARMTRMDRSGTARKLSAPQRVASLPNRGPAPRRSRPVKSGRRFVPAHLRTAQVFEQPYIESGSPVIDSGYPIVEEGTIGGGVIYDDGGYGPEFDEGYEEGGCDSCGESGAFFDAGDSCCGRGGCPEGPCWLSRFGSAFANGQYFTGAVGFQNGAMLIPGGNGEIFAHDCNFGFYGGVNLSAPLCRLSCGLLSGQLGFRSVQTNFDGNAFTWENRDQLFITGGVYRRVDYGLQFGVVADVLLEDWFTNTQTVQIRSDLGWVYGGGTTFGFRYTDNVMNETTSGSYGGVGFTGLFTTTEDAYQFYLRRPLCEGGYGEVYFGWTDSSQTIFGAETDVPLTERLAIQGGFTYYLDDTPPTDLSGWLGGQPYDAWNVFFGIVWRPAGRSSYRSYDRPLFNVADNGSMLLRRR